MGERRRLRGGVLATVLATLAWVAASAPAQAAPLISVSGGSAPEGTGGTPAFTTATFTVTSSEVAPAGGITVLYQTQGAGSGATAATAGQDYTVPSGNSVLIPAGATSATVTVPVAADGVDEEDQLFALRLTNATSGGAIVDAAHNVAVWTIVDDDPPPTVSIADGYEGTSASSPLTEGTGPVRQMTFEVTLSAISEKSVRVDYDAIPGTAKAQVTPGDDGDYQPPAAGHAPLTINAGSTQGKIFVSIIADARDEVDEQFTVKLSNPINATFARDTAVGKIVDDDGPTASVLDASASEGAFGQATGVDVTVLLSQASVQDVTFSYTTADGSAVAPGDYDAVATPQAVTIPAGRLTASIHLTVRGDDIDEGDEQLTVKLALTPSSNATLSDASATVTIKDDDAPPALSIGSVRVPEGTGDTSAATLTIGLAAPAARKLKLGYATADGTATAGVDYQAAAATLDVDAGATSAQVTIPIAPDAVLEPDETFTVTVFHTTTDASGQTVPDPSAAPATATVTIADDDLTADNTPTLRVDGARVREGDSGSRPATFTIRLDAPSPRPVAVSYATADDTADAGSDYRPADGRVTLAPGQTTASVAVDVLGDTRTEANEAFELVLSDAANARIGEGRALGVVIDDDVGGGPLRLATTRLRSASLLCASKRGCRGLLVRWRVQRAGTVSVAVRVTLPARKAARGRRQGARAAAGRRLKLVQRTLRVRAGAGHARVRVRAGGTARRLRARLRAAHVDRAQVTLTFTNRQGGQQTPVRRTVRFTDLRRR